MIKKYLLKVLAIVIFTISILTAKFSTAQYSTSVNYQIENPSTSIEGGISTSSSFQYISSSGQLIDSQTTSLSNTSNAGFLYFPVATTPVVTTASSDGAVSVLWTTSVGTLANVTSYSVGIATSSGGSYAYTSTGGLLAYVYNGLSNGTTYYFKVRSYAAGVLLSESAFVSGTPTASVQGGGGGGGGGGGFIPPVQVGGSTINFSGRAFPSSKVTILKDGVVAVSTTSDPLANFSVNLNNLGVGNYNFSVYGEDSKGSKSTSFSFPVTVAQDSSINIGGIFLAPTIDVDKSHVKRGDNLIIFGQSVPDSSITISVHSEQEYFNKVNTDKNGAYLLNFDSTPLEYGDHSAKSKSAYKTEISPFGSTVAFKIGTESKKKEAKSCDSVRADLNCDKKVNLVDFSVLAYWYKKNNPPKNIDLNNDGKVNLVDFSIMAYNWTG